MAQYFPVHRAVHDELLNRRIRESEYNRVLRVIGSLGFTNGWIQDFESQDYYRPDFSDRVRPFQGRESYTVEGETAYGTHDRSGGEG
jgi:putative pyruvate formate lyase activating enzyme